MTLTRFADYIPGFDRRADTKNYGINGGWQVYGIRGKSGAVTLIMLTNYFPLSTFNAFKYDTSLELFSYFTKPRAHSIGYHSIDPGVVTEAHECPYVPTGRCYGDASFSEAQYWVDNLMHKGTEWLWPALEEYYYQRFPQDIEEEKECGTEN